MDARGRSGGAAAGGGTGRECWRERRGSAHEGQPTHSDQGAHRARWGAQASAPHAAFDAWARGHDGALETGRSCARWDTLGRAHDAALKTKIAATTERLLASALVEDAGALKMTQEEARNALRRERTCLEAATRAITARWRAKEATRARREQVGGAGALAIALAATGWAIAEAPATLVAASALVSAACALSAGGRARGARLAARSGDERGARGDEGGEAEPRATTP